MRHSPRDPCHPPRRGGGAPGAGDTGEAAPARNGLVGAASKGDRGLTHRPLRHSGGAGPTVLTRGPGPE